MRTCRWSNNRAVRHAAVVLATAVLVGGRPPDASGAARWVTGTDFQKRLARQVNIAWSGNPLRSALQGLSEAQRVAVLIDRRVDPGQKLELQIAGVPLRMALEEIARSRGLGVSLLGSVAYFGPPEVAARLRTIAALRKEEIRRLSPVLARKFAQVRSVAWDDFATPRELIERLGSQDRLELVGLEQVPHDLWAAGALPATSLVDRLTLIAVQFDLTFDVSPDAKAIRLVPVPDDVTLVRSYPGGSRPNTTAERFAAMVPDARVKVVGSMVYVKGLLEEHERISAPRRPATQDRHPSPANAGKTRIDKMSVQNVPVGKVLEHLAAQLKLDLRIDHQGLQAAGVSLEQLISVNVENVTVDELLSEVIKSCPLKWVRRNNVVEIKPLD